MKMSHIVLLIIGSTFLSNLLILPDGVRCRDALANTEEPTKTFPEGQPALYCDEPLYNFGKVYKYENIKHVFVIQNRGAKELKLRKIKTSCGCVVGKISDKKIAPGMSGKIFVNFRTDPDIGIVEKNIKIRSNDPETPVYTLKLSGEVIEDITVNPRQIRFGYVTEGEKAYAEIDIQPRPGFELEIKDVIPSAHVVGTQYKKAEGKNTYIVEATLKDDATVGVWTGNIYIYTNSEKQKQIIIPFSGEVLGDIQVYPPHLYFGVVKKTSECKKSVFITLLKEKIEVEKIEAQPEFLTSNVVIEPQNNTGGKKSRTLRILTKIKKDAQIGKIHGIVKIYTNSKIQPVIDIPVSGEIIEG